MFLGAAVPFTGIQMEARFLPLSPGVLSLSSPPGTPVYCFIGGGVVVGVCVFEMESHRIALTVLGLSM